MSAFAGLIALIAGWPLNSIVTKRGIAIQKSVLAARDKRMGVLTELFGSVSAPSRDSCSVRLIVYAQVKFIKLFAWEDKWIKRALDAKEVEIRWLTKGVSSYLGYKVKEC